jgi:hypothetical protein
MNLTNEKLDLLQTLCDEASLGPWQMEIDTNDECTVTNSRETIALFEWIVSDNSQPNAFFIAEAREALPALLAEVRALRQAMAWVPVRERLPEDSYPVLVAIESLPSYFVTLGTVHYYEHRRSSWVRNDGEGTLVDAAHITHWRLLPAPPHAAQEGGAQG